MCLMEFCLLLCGHAHGQRLPSGDGHGHIRRSLRPEKPRQGTVTPPHHPRLPSLVCSQTPFLLSPPTLKPQPAHRRRASPCGLSGTSSMATTPRVSAVIFDLDETLLDSESVTRGVLNDFLATYGKSADAEKEEGRLGQTFNEYAAGIITDYGLPLTLEEYLEAIFPLYLKRTERQFFVILGVDQVPRGKPFPDIYLEAAKRLGVNPSSCLVIEDSLVGIRGAKASGAKVVADPSLQTERQRYLIADLVLCLMLDFHPELWGLPPFDDYIQGALPIEPLYSNARVRNVVSNNSHMIVAGEHTYDSIPDQLSGLAFGWAKLEPYGVSKVVVSIGWDLSLSAAGRVIHICFLDSCCNAKTGESLELLLVGYIRELQSTGGSTSQALSITEQDQSIARDALELPAFSELEELTLFAAPGKRPSE